MFSWEAWVLALDLRDLLRLVTLSVAIGLVAPVLFQQNAPSRRQFLLWAAASLLVLPWFAGWLNLAIPVGVGEFSPSSGISQISMQQLVPAWLVWSVAAVSLVGVGRVWWSARAQRRAVMLLPELEDVRLQRLALVLLKPLGLAVVPHFRLHQETASLPQAPFATSKAGGQLVLPLGYQQLDDTTLRAIITHEFVHLARRDDWGRLMLRVLVSAYWFLPWLRKLERNYLDAMEHSCDDRAADFFGPSLSYMEAVVGVAGIPVGVPVGVPTAPARQHQHLDAELGQYRTVHPLLHRVLRFGQRREFDADAVRVAGYLTLTMLVGLTLASLQPVAKPHARPGLVATAGLALPVALAQAPTLKQQVQVTLAKPIGQQGQTKPITRLTALEQPLPIYPGTALRAELEGEVWVDYLIAMDGSVVNPVVVHSKPAGLFENSALSTVRRTRYQHLSQYSATPLNFARAGPAASELRVRQRFRYQLQPSY